MPDKKIHDPHDTIFKTSFSDRNNTIDLINGTFPKEIVEHLQLETLTLESTTYIDRKLKKYYSDLVYTCKYKESDILITILFEHKSYLPEFPHVQLLRYILNIQEHSIANTNKLIFTLPVVFYHGKDTWKKRSFSEYFNIKDDFLLKFIPNFDYLVIDLSGYSHDDIKQKITGQLLKILMQIMKYSHNENILNENLEKIFKIGKLYIEEPKGLIFFEKIIRYLYEIDDNLDVDKLMEIVKENDDKAGGVIMSTATKLIQKGETKNRIEVAKRMLKNGVDLTTISEYTDLPIVEIKKLK
ncbi:MAG: hypothetical protein A2355_06695 [Spirochaetes bacterium RIFOXYB1_FULL_32_8]|nr:MAG: hypothetical protein A2355_06695 [Spirochaetes bacterium RIFOXYB1_FULL_32_8]HBD93211.1 hypothetical protein [Spirochaetia bacterium]HBI39286.1 hypothetical protein [Spirochaetia bacterium]